MSLFDAQEADHLARSRPLAARMRPRTLDEFVGQRHFLGPGKLLRRLIDADRLTAVLFYGPPGTGKTTLARLLAEAVNCRFVPLNAVTGGVKDLRAALDGARDELAAGGRRTLLFVDEIHRFNKAQQDALLPDVEEGVVTLAGATTANPFFSVNDALVSRSSVFEFEPLDAADVGVLLRRAVADVERGFGALPIEVADDAFDWLADACDGDARRALGTLEIAVLSTSGRPVRLTRELLAESMQRKAMRYDAQGDSHYDAASALIKSVRGSDPDAALYWLARMLAGGEEVAFLCRRLVILASEDIGNAEPRALPLAVAGLQACQFVGLPECQLTLAQVVTFLACAPKSNACTAALQAATADVLDNRLLPVPKALRDAHYAGADRLERGTAYVSPHAAPGGVVAQDYLGVDRIYYRPVDRGEEALLARQLDRIRRQVRPPEDASRSVEQPGDSFCP
jgi:putative ATPase